MVNLTGDEFKQRYFPKYHEFQDITADMVKDAKHRSDTFHDYLVNNRFLSRVTCFRVYDNNLFGFYKQSKDMIDAFKLFYERYGKAVRTITADNGSEFISWDFLEYVQKELKIKLYYCTPSSPHQRGSNENRNGKLRNWFPKGTSFKTVKQRQLDEVADKMNAMPMRIALKGKSPIELFDKEYKTMQRYRRAYAKRKLKNKK
ncbi:IS30 family transposase [Leuconostoc carnosum]|nr:IS30 family transposase [Leuconostoc carnosum]KAA8365798.1 IS30 family transposase [Leuconostoc carnosum]